MFRFHKHNQKKGNRGINMLMVSLTVASVYVTGCSKGFDAPAAAVNETAVKQVAPELPQLQASKSTIVLLEGNANNMAVDFSWAPYKNEGYQENYELEVAVAGTGFAAPVTMAATSQTRTSFDVQGFNNQLRQAVIAGVQTRVEFRVKISSPGETVYSRPIAMEVTPYQPYRKMNDIETIRIPGNYQGWKIPGAPQIVSLYENGQYEGFINFTDANTEFMMIKGTDKWESLRTFTDIGAGKFGFAGKTFMPKEGAGIYRFFADANNNTWSLTKVNFWSLSGSAVNGGERMEFDGKTKTWSTVVSLKEGEFVFRANNEGKVVLGHNIEEGVGTLGTGSGKIQVTKAGTYKVVLSVLTAGNYHYGLQRVQG